jgi:long-subunit fatty acid transport protein
MRRLYLAVWVLSALVSLPNSALLAATLFQQVGIASSPNPVGSGARAVGMGGAFIAVADDATAASWNPAGLIQLERPELSIVGEFVYRKEQFSSDDHPEIGNRSEDHNTNINYFSATYPFTLYRNMVVSINYQRLYDFDQKFDYRFNLAAPGLTLSQDKHFSQNGYLGALGLAGAVEITPGLSLGATLNIWTDKLLWQNGWTATYSEQASGTLGGAPVETTTNIKDKYSDFHGVNANFGLLWDVTEHLTAGAVFKTPFTGSLDHEFTFSQVQTIGPPVNSVITNQAHFKENVDLEMPMSYGVGVAWRFSDEFTVDLDVYRTDWSNYFLKDSNGNKFSPIDGRPKGESHVKDTTQVRAGGEYLFIFPNKELVVPVRAGLFYDPQPSEGSPEEFYGFALGSGIAHKGFIFDVAYQLRWGTNVDTGNMISSSKADIYQHSFLASVIYHF